MVRLVISWLSVGRTVCRVGLGSSWLVVICVLQRVAMGLGSVLGWSLTCGWALKNFVRCKFASFCLA